VIDSARGSKPQIDRPSGPAPSTEKSAWRRRVDLGRASAGRLLLGLLSKRHSALIAMILVLTIPIGAGIVWFAASPSGLRKSQSGNSGAVPSSLLSHGTKAKPAPGKPMVAAPPPQSLPPPPVSPVILTQQPAIPSQIAVPGTAATVGPAPIARAAPPAPVPTLPSVPQHSPMVYQAKHDKAFGGGCSGQLSLSPNGLAFNCSDDPAGSMQIALNQIGSADENGVRLLSGKKYHFSIRGMTKSGEEALFLNWLHQVR
jgi:hypothetical protein